RWRTCAVAMALLVRGRPADHLCRRLLHYARRTVMDNTKKDLMVVIGFAIQPFVCALLAFVSFPILEYTGRGLYGGRPADPLDAAIAVAAGTGLVGFFVTLVAALPSFLWLRSRGLLSRGL